MVVHIISIFIFDISAHAEREEKDARDRKSGQLRRKIENENSGAAALAPRAARINKNKYDVQAVPTLLIRSKINHMLNL